MQLDTKHWVDNWNRVGPMLEKLESESLRSPDYGDGLKAFLPTLEWVCNHAVPRKTSGLVEQQRLFAKLRERREEGKGS